MGGYGSGPNDRGVRFYYDWVRDHVGRWEYPKHINIRHDRSDLTSLASDRNPLDTTRGAGYARRAFTLVELLVVIAIIAYLDWLAAASNSNGARRRDRRAVHQQS